ncbi:tlde1 domain-containing protein [Methylobacterium sp. JK268]
MALRDHPFDDQATRRRWLAPRRGLIRSLLAIGGVAWFALASDGFDPGPADEEWEPLAASIPAEPPAPPPSPVAQRIRQAWLLDPNPSFDPSQLALRKGTLPPEMGAFVAPRTEETTPIAAATLAAPRESPVQLAAIAEPTPPASLAPDARLVLQPVPLPVPRPAEFRLQRPPETPRFAERQSPRRARAQSSATAMADTRSFFDKLFGGSPQPSGPALAYASADPAATAPAPRVPLSPSPFPPMSEATAIYDITAGSVTLPNGERLEAHSGLGDKMDDPRYVHVPMRGATPPGTYDLTERERLFHGVRAIRLNPVGGSGAIHGRVGLLAHTYMLGPSGASNGCVSFRQYDRFLQAFLRGEVRRLVVVAGRG